MNQKREEAPSNLRSLTARIENLAKERETPRRRIERVIANTVVGQMLPPGVVKGGTAMKLRIGEAGSRFTPDIDAARSETLSLDQYIDQLGELTASGWGGFTGTVVEVEGPRPDNVPQEYIMQPFKIQLAYKGRHWLTVIFELGRDEVGSTQHQELRIASDILEMFEYLCLDTPDPIPLLAVDHQVAQKLHACTSVNAKIGGNERAHDLVDLQLLDIEETIDLQAVANTATRLFAARRSHPWPPTVVAYEKWRSIYDEAADRLDVLADDGEAVVWANEFIMKVVEARSQSDIE